MNIGLKPKQERREIRCVLFEPAAFLNVPLSPDAGCLGGVVELVQNHLPSWGEECLSGSKTGFSMLIQLGFFVTGARRRPLRGFAEAVTGKPLLFAGIDERVTRGAGRPEAIFVYTSVRHQL